jgi:CRISPR-associated exonuclease Cas4
VFLPILSLLIFLAGLALLWQSGRRRKAAGLPAGRIIYTDTSRWGPVEKSLYDPVLGLTGRPDYLVQQDDQVILPVEVKSTRVAEGPYDSHIFQLAAYCRLVEQTFGKRPPYGILHYANRTFAIDYTPELEAALAALLEEMRAQDRRKVVARSHDSGARCRSCGYRSVCDQKIET